MAFRHDGKKTQEWKQWLARNGAALVRAGIPDWLLRDKLRWLGFLEHSGWDAESGFKVDMLTLDQARELHGFLIREYGASLSGGCIEILERRISRGTTTAHR